MGNVILTFDEALLEGEQTGSLIVMADTGNKNIPYEETRYVLNRVTDGHMVKFFTTENGKTTKLEGKFHEVATVFDLSLWSTHEKLMFNAVTEQEFKQSYEEYKTKAKLF